jgi:hypothetical protein
MSVILRGLGLDQNSFSSIVAFGLTIKLSDVDNPIVELENVGIEQMFAVDYSGSHRPLTLDEWRQWKRILAQIRKGDRIVARKHRQIDRLNMTFARKLQPRRKAA